MSQTSQLNTSGGGGPGTPIQTLTGNDGIPVPPTGNNVDILGVGGVDISGDIATSTLSIAIKAGGFSWNVVTNAGNPHQIIAQNGYICAGAVLVTFLLPVSPAIGDTFKIFSFTSRFQIIPNGAQQLVVGAVTGVAGASGTCTSNSPGDEITMTYMGGNVFQSEAPQGTMTVIYA